MEEYKKINKQLITQIQEMRIKEGQYRQEITALWEMIMDERHKRVELEHKLVTKLTKNFRGVLEEINSELSILKILDDDTGANGGTKTNSALSNSININHGRKSSETLQQRTSSRYSSCGINRERYSNTKSSTPRNSLEQKSPIRRSPSVTYNAVHKENIASNAQIDVSEREEEADDMDLEDNDVTKKNKDNEVADEEQNITDPLQVAMDIAEALARHSIESIVTPKLLAIHEADEHEEQEIEVHMNRRNNRRNAQVFRISPLQDISNTTNDSTQKEKLSISQLDDISNATNNTTQKENLSMTLEKTPSPQIVVQRGKIHNGRSNRNNESIEMPRCCNEDFPKNLKLLPNIRMCEKENMSNTMLSTSEALSELTIRNFEDAPCSTPRLLRSSHTNASVHTKTSELESATAEASTINLSNRPSRRCKPATLMEPSLRAKLRSDVKTKPRVKNKKNK